MSHKKIEVPFSKFINPEEDSIAQRWLWRRDIPRISKEWTYSVKISLFDLPGAYEVRNRLSRNVFKAHKFRLMSIHDIITQIAHEWSTTPETIASYIHSVFWFPPSKFARQLVPDLLNFFEYKSEVASQAFTTLIFQPSGWLDIDAGQIRYYLVDNVVLFNLNDIRAYFNLNLTIPIHSLTVSMSSRYKKYSYSDFESMDMVVNQILKQSDVLRYLVHTNFPKLTSATGYIASSLNRPVFTSIAQGLLIKPVQFRHKGYYKIFYENIITPVKGKTLYAGPNQLYVSYNALSFIVRANIHHIAEKRPHFAKVCVAKWLKLKDAIFHDSYLSWYMMRGYNKPLRTKEVA